MKRRKDRENEGFLFAKRRAEKLDGTTKKWDRWEGVGFKSTAAFHRMDFSAANFCRV